MVDISPYTISMCPVLNTEKHFFLLKIARTEQGKSRQFGFVNFTTHKSASLAVEKKHDSMLRGMPLFVTFHQTKSERSAFMEQRLYQRLERVAGKVDRFLKFSSHYGLHGFPKVDHRSELMPFLFNFQW